jgi:hypothetical protein
MFSEIQMKQSTGVCLDDIRKLKETLLDADAVVIGAGSGLFHGGRAMNIQARASGNISRIL